MYSERMICKNNLAICTVGYPTEWWSKMSLVTSFNEFVCDREF